MQVTLHLHPGRGPHRRPGSAADLAALTRISRRALADERHKSLKKPIARLRKFARMHGLSVVRVDPTRCRVVLRGAAADIERAFATKLRDERIDDAHYRHPTRAPRLPEALGGIVHAVLGIDERPRGNLRSMANGVADAGLWPSDIARLYGMTAKGRGAGQCIAIVEPSGGYDPADLVAACAAMNVPVPAVRTINVGSGRNNFGADAEADKEVSLDIQVVAAVAPLASIAVYFTGSNEAELVDGLKQAVHDAATRPSVIVMTWGEPESFWPKAARMAMDAALADAVRLGITVVAAAGDDLASERVGDGKAHVDYPASSPYVLGCGGTSITLDAAGRAIAAETVWNTGDRGTGGGISDVYPVPAFQTAAALPKSFNDGKVRRGVPDVAAAAAEENGYRIKLNGADTIASGTSAVAPLWAAFLALINEQRGETLGLVTPLLYRNAPLLRPVTSGNNKGAGSKIGYNAGPGWNACTGLGTPRGPELVAALSVKH